MAATVVVTTAADLPSPEESLLRLKAGKTITGFPAPAQKIFQAMKTYGLIVADNGSTDDTSGEASRAGGARGRTCQ